MYECDGHNSESTFIRKIHICFMDGKILFCVINNTYSNHNGNDKLFFNNINIEHASNVCQTVICNDFHNNKKKRCLYITI